MRKQMTEQQIFDLCDNIEEKTRRAQRRVYAERHEQREYEMRDFRNGERRDVTLAKY